MEQADNQWEEQSSSAARAAKRCWAVIAFQYKQGISRLCRYTEIYIQTLPVAAEPSARRCSP